MSPREVLELADIPAAPAGHSLCGKEIIHYENLVDVGMSGLLSHGVRLGARTKPTSWSF
ncbi:MAG: hypothetical protein ACYC1Z_11360 [Georgenia sp.]